MKKLVVPVLSLTFTLAACSVVGNEQTETPVEIPTRVQRVGEEYVVTIPEYFRPGEYEVDTLSKCYKEFYEKKYRLTDNSEEVVREGTKEMSFVVAKRGEVEEHKALCRVDDESVVVEVE